MDQMDWFTMNGVMSHTVANRLRDMKSENEKTLGSIHREPRADIQYLSRLIETQITVQAAILDELRLARIEKEIKRIENEPPPPIRVRMYPTPCIYCDGTMGAPDILGRRNCKKCGRNAETET